MKILQAIIAFYPNQIWGGPPQNTYILSKNLIARGHEVKIVTSNILDRNSFISDKSVDAYWEEIPVTYLKSYWWGKKPNSVGYIITPDLWRYRKLIRDADVVHIHGYRNFLFSGVSLLAKYYGVPYVIQPRGALVEKFGRVNQKLAYDRTIGQFILRNASYIIILSEEEREKLVFTGVSPDKIIKIYNPLDPSLFSYPPDGLRFRAKYKIDQNDFVILFLSRLHEKKGLDILIEALAGINRSDVRLLIVGPDDGYLSVAEKLISKYNLQSRTIITGPIYGDEKFDAYRAADIYVLPTRGGEGLPTTIVEACWVGIPIIVTNTTEVSQIINKRIGLAVNDDVLELRNAILELLSNSRLRSYFKEQTIQVLNEYFDLGKALDRFEFVYKSCISHRNIKSGEYSDKNPLEDHK